MKVTADDQRRVTLPDDVNPGDTFELRQEEAGRFVLVKESEAESRPRLVREGNYYVLDSACAITLEDTLKAIERYT